MCFGNHKQKGNRNVWALLVALNKCCSFSYLTLLETFSSSLIFKNAAFKFLFSRLATTNVCVGLFGQPSVIDHLHLRSERAMKELLVRKSRNVNVIASASLLSFACNNCNDCGPTRSSDNVQIQTNCNSNANACGCSWLFSRLRPLLVLSCMSYLNGLIS